MLNIKTLNVFYTNKGIIKILKSEQKFNIIKKLIKLRRLEKQIIRKWIKINLKNFYQKDNFSKFFEK